MHLCQLLSHCACNKHTVRGNDRRAENPWTNWLYRSRLYSQLEEIATARRKLFLEVEALDAREKVLCRQINSNAPISILPDDVLAMIFEAGALLEQGNNHHFGSLVSHMNQRWRNIALATPRLWNRIDCIKPKGLYTYPDEWVERDAMFLSRSRSFPVEIYISDFITEDDFSQDFIELIRDHIGHCRRLSITRTDDICLSTLLGDLSCKPAPLLSSIKLSCSVECDEDFKLDRPLFPLGTPHLTTVQLQRIEMSSLPFCLPTFTNTTSLKLTGIWINEERTGDLFRPLREALMTLHALNHLELQLESSSTVDDLHSPMVLPTVRFLHVNRTGECPDDIIHSIYAESLITLSIDGWDRLTPQLNLSREGELESHFPSLQHLILRNIFPDAPDLRVVARKFPGIEQLTCHARVSLNPATSDIYHVITHTTLRQEYTADDEDDEGAATSRQSWPKLHIIAVTASDTSLDVVTLHDEISHLQAAGHPIRKLKLPKQLCEMAGAEAMAHLRTVIEVEDFSMDWPTPFEFI